VEPPPRDDLLAIGANLALGALAAEVTKCFRDARLGSVLIKGPVLVRWLYGRESARTSSDVDFLIDPATLGAAEGALRELGFERAPTGIGAADRPRHANTWMRAASAAVDLHTTLVGVGVEPSEVWSTLRERTAVETLGDVPVDVPEPEFRLLLLALHAAQHGEQEPQPIRDLEQALSISSAEEWRDAATLARLVQAEEAFAAGLGLTEGGRRLSRELQLSGGRTLESALRARTAPPLTLGLDWFVQLPGLRPRLRFLVLKLFPPASFMRTWSSLARRGPAGLVAAYVWRPVWILARTTPALRAWRRARKESRP
jgi:hypothetical protein